MKGLHKCNENGIKYSKMLLIRGENILECK